jgi:hypothetical protein
MSDSPEAKTSQSNNVIDEPKEIGLVKRYISIPADWLLHEAFGKEQVVITDQSADISATTQEAELEKIEADIDARLARIVELQAVINQLREDSQRRSAALSQIIAEL